MANLLTLMPNLEPDELNLVQMLIKDADENKQQQFAMIYNSQDITDIKQLRGKRLGIGQYGGGPDFASRIVLEKHGLIPDKDVRIVQMLVPDSGRLAALQAGVIESILLQAPTSLRAPALGFNQILDYSTELLFPLASLTTTRAYIRQSPAVVKRVVRAHLDAVRFMVANEDAALKILGKYTKINDTAFLREYHRKIILPRLSQNLAPDRAAIGCPCGIHHTK